MGVTREARLRLAGGLLEGRPAAAADVQALREALQALESAPQEGGARWLSHDDGRLRFDLSYEIGELQKDLIYLEQGEAALLRELGRRQPGFAAELEAGRAFLAGARGGFRTFLTDRDGTVNNYCGRYYSSIQSVYNAVFLVRFARRCGRAVLLSSAPLQGGGLADVSVIPAGLYVLAGSKGREALDERGRHHRLGIPRRQQAALQRLNRELSALVQRREFRVFALIGSGLQFKFGQSTVAHQDVHDSIPADLSSAFRAAVRDLVRRLDPDGSAFRIEDTGRDLEIMLTVAGSGTAGPRDFDKGDGVRYLDKELRLGLARGSTLVCGDTASDLPMVRAAVEAGGETWGIFVTRDRDLCRELRVASGRSCCVGAPDVLVALLNEMGKEKR